MSNIVTPSEMTGQQIDKAVANYRAMLVKHSPNYQSAAVQTVLSSADFAKAQSILFRDRVEAASSLITRTVPVNRGRTAKAAMLAVNCEPYLDEEAFASIPIGTGDIVTMSFFRFGRDIADNKLDEEFAKVGLRHVVDPIGQAAVNEADLAFSGKYPNRCQWKNADGKSCFVIFDCWGGKPGVSVGQDPDDWNENYWFPVRSM